MGPRSFIKYIRNVICTLFSQIRPCSASCSLALSARNFTASLYSTRNYKSVASRCLPVVSDKLVKSSFASKLATTKAHSVTVSAQQHYFSLLFAAFPRCRLRGFSAFHSLTNAVAIAASKSAGQDFDEAV